MFIHFTVILNLLFFCEAGQVIYEDAANSTGDVEIHEHTKLLSRRKRFLVFPEGSSFQIVFCNSVPLNSAIGDILFFGYTAALAYELPQDPYSPFMHHADPQHRRVDTKEIYYLNENGKIIHRQPYKRKFIVNPAFAKRSVDVRTSETETKQQHYETNRQQMHGSSTREFLRGSRMDRRSVEFHRTSRALLYRKIETLLQGLGGNGKECLLKTLCLVGQTREGPQGTFFQEILRAIFTLPKAQTIDEDLEEYDQAHWSKESCDELYPDCRDPIKGPELASI